MQVAFAMVTSKGLHSAQDFKKFRNISKWMSTLSGKSLFARRLKLKQKINLVTKIIKKSSDLIILTIIFCSSVDNIKCILVDIE